MANIINLADRSVVDYMSRDYDSFLQSMRKNIPEMLPEWKTYESEADFGNVLLQLFAHMGDVLSYYQDRVANESFLATAQTRRSVIHHLGLIGYRLSTAAPASATLTITVPAQQTEVMIRKGDAFSTKSLKESPSVRFEYAGEDKTFRVPEDQRSAAQWTFALPVEEGRLVSGEILGTSDGSPNQRFTLAHTGLILRYAGTDATRDVALAVTPDDSPGVPWNLRETLAFSREGQKDFIIEVDENDRATVMFGDGAFGRIPSKGAVITVSYRVGGGVKGNVPADAIQTVIAPQLSRIAAKATNTRAATGGAERETMEHAVRHAPNVFRSLKRAVTAGDFQALALQYPGVGKVRAVAGNWNTVNLFVAPQGGGSVSDVLRAGLMTYFEDKRPVTTVIEVQDVRYRKIYISAKIGIERNYLVDEVREKVIRAAADILAFDRVDFNAPLYLSKFYEAIEAVDGLDHVTITEFRIREDAKDTISKDGMITLNENELPKIPDGLFFQVQDPAGNAGTEKEYDRLYLCGINIIETTGGIYRAPE